MPGFPVIGRDQRTGDGIESKFDLIPSPIAVPCENRVGWNLLIEQMDMWGNLILHNHPSGDPTPSSADVDMTRQIVDAVRALKITVHDHLVVGLHGVASFKALGLI
jgi:hypothetical protein